MEHVVLESMERGLYGADSVTTCSGPLGCWDRSLPGERRCARGHGVRSGETALPLGTIAGLGEGENPNAPAATRVLER